MCLRGSDIDYFDFLSVSHVAFTFAMTSLPFGLRLPENHLNQRKDQRGTLAGKGM